MRLSYSYYQSPVGKLLLAGNNEGLTHISFPTGSMKQKPSPDWQLDQKPFVKVKKQLGEYFEGKRKTFSVKLSPSGTEFQRSVLDALQEIPYGVTKSYGDIAQAVGRPKAARAVGSANRRNPISIIIPCHRVIGGNGRLTGFGGGLKVKAKLLELEAAHH